MELVEGITLKKYIEKKARLSFKEAVSIAIQVGMGIEAAHNNHIIHRDIKHRESPGQTPWERETPPEYA